MEWEGQGKDTPPNSPNTNSNTSRSSSDIQSYSDEPSPENRQPSSPPAAPPSSPPTTSPCISVLSSEEDSDSLGGEESTGRSGRGQRGARKVRSGARDVSRRVKVQGRAGYSSTAERMEIGSFVSTTPVKHQELGFKVHDGPGPSSVLKIGSFLSSTPVRHPESRVKGHEGTGLEIDSFSSTPVKNRVMRVRGQVEAGASSSKKIGSFFASTPVKQSKIAHEVAEDIQSSDSDNADDATTPGHTPSSALHLSLARPGRKTGRGSLAGGLSLPFELRLINTSPPDHVISSPSPSSEEEEGEGGGAEWEGDLNALKAADWIKQVHPDSTDISRSCDLSDTLKTPVDSAKKKPHKRLVPGGVAERLRRLVQRGRSEVTFWEHRTRTLKEEDVGEGLSDCLLVHVQSLRTCCSIAIATCKVLQGTVATPPAATPTTRGCGSEEEGGGAVELVTVLFSLHCAQFVGLAAGKQIRIHPPWRTVSVEAGVVILCPQFCMAVGFSPVSSPPPLPSPSPLRGSFSRTALSRSPIRGGLVPTRLFTSPRRLDPISTTITPTRGRHMQATPLSPPLSETRTYDHSHTSDARLTSLPLAPTSLLDALAGTRGGVVAGFVGTIVGMFRRAGGGGAYQQHSREGGVRQKQASQMSYSWSWSLLVKDRDDVFAEIRMPPHSRLVEQPAWGILVERGEGRHCYFSKLKLERRLNPLSEPGLFSVIASRLQATKHSASDQQEGVGSVAGPSPSSSSSSRAHLVCYSMEWQGDTHFQLCAVSERDTVTAEGGGATAERGGVTAEGGGVTAERGGGSSERDGSTDQTVLKADMRGCRIDMLARVISLEPEISLPPSVLRSFHCPPVQCGHFLTVSAIPSASDVEGGDTVLISSSVERGDFLERERKSGGPISHEEETKGSETGGDDLAPKLDRIRLYLKRGFVIAELHEVLRCPGAVVYLKDVAVQPNPGPLQWSYTMDVCSLLIPVQSHDLHMPRPYPTLQLGPTSSDYVRLLRNID